MYCIAYYVCARHHFKHYFIKSSNDIEAGVFCHLQFIDEFGGRMVTIRRSLQIHHKLHH